MLLEATRLITDGIVQNVRDVDLGMIYGPFLVVLYLLALGSISFYQITRRGHEDRVATLGERAV